MATTRKPISTNPSAEAERENLIGMALEIEGRMDKVLTYAYNSGLPDLLIRHLRALRYLDGQLTTGLQAYNHRVNEGRLGELLPLPDEQETIQ